MRHCSRKLKLKNDILKRYIIKFRNDKSVAFHVRLTFIQLPVQISGQRGLKVDHHLSIDAQARRLTLAIRGTVAGAVLTLLVWGVILAGKML